MRRTRALGLLLAAISIGIACLAGWPVFRGRTANPVEDAAARSNAAGRNELDREPLAESSTPRSRAQAAVVATTDVPLRSSVVRAVSNALADECVSLSGRLVFEDGSIPPEIDFGLTSEEPTALSSTSFASDRETELPARRCACSAFGCTDQTGFFSVGGLCAGEYEFSLSRFAELGPLEGVYRAPARDLRVVLHGYLIELMVVDEFAQPLVDQRVILKLRSKDPRSTGAVIDQHTDSRGVVWAAFRDPCELAVRAEVGLRASSEVDVSLRGPSARVSRILAVDSWRPGATLSVSVVTCDGARVPIQNYCISLSAVASDAKQRRFCSEDVGPDGIFHGIEPGRYRVAAVPRFDAGLVSYLESAVDRRPEVDLVEGGANHVELCVDVGGHLAIRLVSEGGGKVSRAKRTLFLTSHDGSDPVRLCFRETDETSATSSLALPLGVRMVTEQAFPAGRYTLKVIGTRQNDVEQIVQVQAMKVTDVDVTLSPEKR